MASEFVTSPSHRTGPADLRFLHYNDVYHIEYALSIVLAYLWQTC